MQETGLSPQNWIYFDMLKKIVRWTNNFFKLSLNTGERNTGIVSFNRLKEKAICYIILNI